MIVIYQIFMRNKQRRKSLGKFDQDSNMSIKIMSLTYNQSIKFKNQLRIYQHDQPMRVTSYDHCS